MFNKDIENLPQKMDYMKNLINICLVLLPIFSFAQNAKIDSLKKELSKVSKDTEKLKTLVLLSKSIGSYNIGESEKYLLEAEELGKTVKDNYSTVKVYEGQIAYYRLMDEFTKAIDYCNKAMEICKKSNFQQEYYNILLQKASSLVRGNKIEEAKVALDEVKNNLQFLDQESNAQMYGSYALLFVEKGEYDLSLDNWEKAISVAQKLKNRQLEGKFTLNSFIPYYKKKDFNACVEVLQKAEKILTEIGDTRSAMYAIMNLSTIYNDLKNYDKCLEINFKMLEISASLKLPLGDTYLGIAQAYKGKGMNKDAEKYFLKSIEENKKLQNEIAIGISKANLGIHYTDIQQYSKALPLLLESSESMKDNNPEVYGICLFKLADTYRGLKMYDDAKHYAKTAIGFNTKYDIKNALREAYMVAFQIEMEMSVSTKAIRDTLWEYFGQVTSLDSAISLYKFNETLADKLTQYETAQKEAQLKISEQGKQLAQAAADRNFWSLVVASFFLLVAIGFVFLFFKYNAVNKKLKEVASHRTVNDFKGLFGNLKDDNGQILPQYQDVAGKLLAIATTQERLAKSTKADDYISITEEIPDFMQNVKEVMGAKKVNIQTDIGKFELRLNKSNALLYLIDELVRNAIKHAFANTTQPEVSLSLHQENGVLHLIFKDNGSGISEGKKPAIIHELVENFNGMVKVSNENGTVYDMVLKANLKG